MDQYPQYSQPSPSSSRSPIEPWGQVVDGKYYWLDVVQQPQRARMCGFGDRDRRPLAPAVIAKLSVTDPNTKQPVPIPEPDIAFHVVSCDLWSEDGKSEVNLVRNPSASASNRRRRDQALGSSEGPREIPSGASTPQHSSQISSVPTAQTPPSIAQQPYDINYSNAPGFQGMPNMGGGGSGASYSAPSSSYGSPSGEYMTEVPETHEVYGEQYPNTHPSRSGQYDSGDQPSQVGFTRTLVGPLSANAQSLVDDQQRPGIFFIFQDLSIRTEGRFRLRLRLMNVGAPPIPNTNSRRVNENSSPILAQAFTDVFQVYSAKKFIGVPEMTALSKTFARQGQKLPLRQRSGPREGGGDGRRSDYESDQDPEAD